MPVRGGARHLPGIALHPQAAGHGPEHGVRRDSRGVGELPTPADRSFTDLLADLADRTPAPGGGAAAAWTGAIAAALLEMAARFADDDPTAARGAELRDQLLQAAEHDLESYVPVLAAFRRPRDEPGRQEELRSALQTASEAPKAMVAAAGEVAQLAHTVAARSRPAVRGDALTAARLGEAAAQAAQQLVEINNSLIERATGDI